MSTDTIDSDTPDFEAWYKELRMLADIQAWDIGAPEDCDMWREYWEDGDSPSDAIEDDMEHG